MCMNKLIAGLVLAVLASVAVPAGAGEIRAVNKQSYFPEGPVWFEGKLYYVEYGKVPARPTYTACVRRAPTVLKRHT